VRILQAYKPEQLLLGILNVCNHEVRRLSRMLKYEIVER
jgi:hypothetical protein